ncbi:unnamed protein product [Phytomonas sp. Hart1]|nr:unnamed protein product [Phytomonas sp. Hart1]|eukprot:CCW66363.1 unnamed protein product [Phytomonas sp. isolate Hart1]
MVDLELDQDSLDEPRFAAIRARLEAVLQGPELAARLEAAWAAPTARVVSLQSHKHTGIRSLEAEAPRVVWFGSPTLTERFCGLQFDIAPTDFFQVNTPAAERMLERLAEVVALGPSSTLLDLCCGAGTIGLVLARHVKKVIGVELVRSSVENAERNARREGIANAVFHAGAVERLLPGIIYNLSPEDRTDIIAILDPPRAGVNNSVLKCIRATSTIRRVVYISCEQKALERDCAGLMKGETKAYRGEPFEVTASFGVDLFPHTQHVEMIVVLTRREPTAADTEANPEDREPPEESSQVGEPNTESPTTS